MKIDYEAISKASYGELLRELLVTKDRRFEDNITEEDLNELYEYEYAISRELEHRSYYF